MFRSYQHTREILSLDPVHEHERIIYLMAGYEFPWDMVRALEVALLRTFSSPRISALLHRTGQLEKFGQKRYDDTALLIAEFMYAGYDSPHGRKTIEHINYIHSHFPIENEDYIYVLSTFVFDPIRWIDRFGWRKTSWQEQQALFHFCRQVGLRMHIQHIPPSLESLQAFVTNYEAKHIRFAQSNRTIADATIRIVKAWLPKPFRAAAFPVINALMDDSMRQAFGYTAPPVWLRLGIPLILKIRARLLKVFKLNPAPYFFHQQPNRTYPEGYEVEQLGPSQLVDKKHQKK